MGRAGCCCGCRAGDRDVDNKSFNDSENEFVVDRYYGCSEIGTLIAVIAILVLIIGAIASTIFIENNKLDVGHGNHLLVLICLVAALIIAFLIMACYCSWQRMNVRRQRAKYGQPYDNDMRQRVNGKLYTSLPTSTSTRTSWLFWSTKKNAMQMPVSPTATTTSELSSSQTIMPQSTPRPAYSTVV